MKYRKLIILFFAFFFMSSTCVAEEKNPDSSEKLVIEIQGNLKKQSLKYAKTVFKEDVPDLWEEHMPKKLFKTKQIILGEPFIVYEPNDQTRQLLWVIYPIFKQGKGIGELQVYCNDGDDWGFQLSDSPFPSETGEMLNKIGYQKNNVIFYKQGNKVIAESRDGNWVYDTLLDGYISQNEKEFARKTWLEKAKEIKKNTEELVKYNFSKTKSTPKIDTDKIKQKVAQKKKKREGTEKKIRTNILIAALCGGSVISSVFVIIYIRRKRCFKG